VVGEGAEVPVAPAVVGVGVVPRVVAARVEEVVDREGAVVSGVEVVAVTEEAGLAPVLAAGGGRTWRYRASTTTHSRDSSRVEVRTRPLNRVRGIRAGI
jgi:hypothetical protein